MAAVNKVFSRSHLIVLTFFMALLELPVEAQSTSSVFVMPSSTLIVASASTGSSGQTMMHATTTASTSDDGQTNTATIEPSPTTAGTQASSSAPSTPEITLVEFSCTLTNLWNSSFLNTSTGTGKKLKTELEAALKNLYNDSNYGFVVIVSVVFTDVEGKVGMKAKVKFSNPATSLEDVFLNKVNSGNLGSDLAVLEGSGNVKPEGVTFGDWKAKSGECEKACSDSETSTGQEFTLDRSCKAESNSCAGLKLEMETMDCTKYCNSVAIRVSVMVVILAAISSFSLQL